MLHFKPVGHLCLAARPFFRVACVVFATIALPAQSATDALSEKRPQPRVVGPVTSVTPLAARMPKADTDTLDILPPYASIGPSLPPKPFTPKGLIELAPYGNREGVVARTGTTLYGAVSAGSGFDVVETEIMPVGRKTTVDVGPKTRQFAVRLFESDFADGDNIEIRLVARSDGNSKLASRPVVYQVAAASVGDGISQAMSRLTFGGNAALYARLQEIGFEAFVDEQLNDTRIENSGVKTLAVDEIVNFHEENFWKFSTDVLGYQLTHAVFSDRQLREVMALFWANHFHAAYKDSSRIHLQMFDDRAFYQENALGRFKDLLVYSARSPLMAQFLDNDESSAGKLNENYARELLELHTLGAIADYTEQDVAEVARIFTGWHYAEIEQADPAAVPRFEFRYRPLRHDSGNKTLSFRPGVIIGRDGTEGYQEGRELLAFLASQPATSSFVCGKIVKLLVADIPPQHFVDSCSITWLVTDGDIRSILEAILKDPSYITTVEYQRNKGKTPYEYSASVARFLALSPEGAQVRDLAMILAKIVRDGGMFPVTTSNPAGEPEELDAWNTTASKQAIYQVAINRFGVENRYGFKTTQFIYQNELETAEVVAAYLLSTATGDRFRQAEFDHIVEILKGDDDRFSPLDGNEADRVRLAWRAVLVMPSFQLQ